MKYIDEFRDGDGARHIAANIAAEVRPEVAYNFMEFCGWHTHATIGTADIKFAYVGDPTGTLLGNCAAQKVSPNGDPGADAMVSVIAHELEEAASDPDLNAWYDSTGAENADKCAWKFGTTTALPTGALYNITLGGMKFLVQQNWKIGSSRLSQIGCAMN